MSAVTQLDGAGSSAMERTTSGVPLLMVSLAWTLVIAGPQRRFAAAAAASATPRNFRELFIGRCEEYQRAVFRHWIHEPKNCVELWQKFHSAFAYKEPCDFDINSYDEFIRAAEHNINTFNKVMYWSGRVTPLVYEFSADGRRHITIRDYLPGYIVKNVYTWCGKNESTSEGPGMDFESCRGWGTCDDKFVASESFWKALSAHFAGSVKGDIRVMLNGSNGQAYRGNRSTFGAYELQNLEASRNPILHVYLVHDIEPRANSVSETCDNGTLIELKKDVEDKQMTFNCIEDPQEVLYVQCVDHVTSSRCQFANRQPQQLPVPAAVASLLFVTSIVTRSVICGI